jgi:AMIN domain
MQLNNVRIGAAYHSLYRSVPRTKFLDFCANHLTYYCPVLRFHLMRSLAVVAGLFVSAVYAIPAWGAGPIEVTAVRHAVVGTTTRITVDVTGDFTYRSDRAHDPERIFFDIFMAKPRIGARNVYAQALSDRLVSRVRMAETSPGVTRVVLDLVTPVEFSVSRAANPPRLVIDLKGPDDAPPAPASSSAAIVASAARPITPVAPPAPIAPAAPRPAISVTSTAAPAPLAQGPSRTVESVPAMQPASEAARFVAEEPPALQISPAAAFRGDRAIVVISLNAKPGSPSVGLQWELTYPSVAVGTDERDVLAGGAALSAGKTLTCTGIADDAAKYLYRCVLAGGPTPIPNGPVAQMTFRVRETARLGPATLEIRNAMAVAPDGKRLDITPSRSEIMVQ